MLGGSQARARQPELLADAQTAELLKKHAEMRIRASSLVALGARQLVIVEDREMLEMESILGV